MDQLSGSAPGGVVAEPRPDRRGVRVARGPARAGLAMVLIAAMGLSGCAGGAMDSASDAFGALVAAGGGPDPAEPAQVETPTRMRCPRVYILPETEVVRRTDGTGSDALRWQASISKTARECRPSGNGVLVRVGVSGRVILGPKGSTGPIELPVRVAVREGNDTTYSKLHSVRVTAQGPSEGWAFVDENVAIAAPNGAQIFVGFDE